MKEIKLGGSGMSALVDDEDYEWLNQWKWNLHKHHGMCYARRYVPIAELPSEMCSLCGHVIKKSRVVIMHRLIMGNPIGKLIDHRNRNGLDNRRINLRECTNGQNGSNRKSSGKSKYLGVCSRIRKREGEEYTIFFAQIRTGGRAVKLGYFKTEEDAARAYNEAAKIYHGEFANLNIIKNEKSN